MGENCFTKSQFLMPGKTRFERPLFEKDHPVLFDDIEVDTGSLQFVDVSRLGNVLFLYSDLEKINFKNVSFRQDQNGIFNRKFLADEKRNEIFFNLRKKISYDPNYYSHVEILYRKLKLNFENQRDYAGAGDFHYGEMEMKREWKMLEFEGRPWVQKMPFLKFLKFFNLTQCYKIVSGYGENWQQALASFVAVLILCTGLNLFWVEPKVAPQETARIEKWGKDSLHRLGGTTLFTFKVLTLQRWEHDFRLKGSSYWPKFFVSIQHLVGPGIIALMLLAIRRKFRR